MMFYGNIQNGVMTLSVSQRLLRKDYLKNLKDGTPFSEEIKPVREGKTHRQIKTIFGLCLATIKAEFDDRGWDSSILLNLPEPTGIEVTVNLIKEYLYAVCPIHSEDGLRITLSHKDCTTKCASDFIDSIMSFAASQWGIYIPAPSTEWRRETTDGN